MMSSKKLSTMTNQEISLKWNGYQSNILSNVKDLLRDDKLADVTLFSGGQSFKAHKVILSANSTVFRSIFQQNPHKDPIIVLHDINTTSLKTLLTFMYNGEVNVTEEFLPVLLKTADALRICGLSAVDENQGGDDEKLPNLQQCKKRKKSEADDSNIKAKKLSPANSKSDIVTALSSSNDCTDLSNNINIVKVEPIDSPLTDYSCENAIDTDLALLDECEKKYSASPDDCSLKPTSTASSEKCHKKWISEVSSTQPCLSVAPDKPADIIDDDKNGIEIDKEVETVLQSGTIVESLSITTENLNLVSSEAHIAKEKTTSCYANPSFPCPFCARIYNSWGYRRRHVKSRHMNDKLSCKWCVSVLPSTSSWYSHATRSHGVPHEEARNSLVVMVEAHAVLSLKEPSVAQLLDQVGITDGGQNNIGKGHF